MLLHVMFSAVAVALAAGFAPVCGLFGPSFASADGRVIHGPPGFEAKLIETAELLSRAQVRISLGELDKVHDNIVVVDATSVCSSFCSTVEKKNEQCATEIGLQLFLGLGKVFAIPGVQAGTNYDTVILMSDFDKGLGPNALAFYVDNGTQVTGLGKQVRAPVFSYGFNGLIEMNSILAAPDDFNRPFNLGLTFLDVLGQEVTHQFGAFVQVDVTGKPRNLLLGRSDAHWSFYLNTNGSVMEGNKWRDEGNDSFRTINPDGGFFELDQYLWGFRPPRDVSPFFVITDFDNTKGDQKPPTLRPGGDVTACSADFDCCGDSGDSCDPAAANQPVSQASCMMRAAGSSPQVCVCCDDPDECPPKPWGENSCSAGKGHCEFLLDRKFGAYNDVVL